MTASLLIQLADALPLLDDGSVRNDEEDGRRAFDEGIDSLEPRGFPRAIPQRRLLAALRLRLGAPVFRRGWPYLRLVGPLL